MAQTTTLTIKRLFTKPKTKAYDAFSWVKRDAMITNPATTQPVFEQKGVLFPEDFSLNSINIVAQKYFSGTPGTADRENSLKDLINRVVDTVVRHGLDEGYFDGQTEAEDFCEELKYVLVSQRAAFNSPVWFNIGVPKRSQQASACFILGIEDNMESILNWYVEEGMIFKGGSGSGINLSPLRSSYEKLGGSGGRSSGPVSFMRGADASAGSIKSGGKTRRAAKMVILNVDHPDVEEFIWCKAIEERKARVLEAAGFDMTLNGKDSFSMQYQNANNSVRVTDKFMQAVENDENWELKAATTSETFKTLKARDLMRQFAKAAWECADPGMQYDTTVNRWHTAPNAGRINASNPCSEYMHLDNSACNLASINVIKYLNPDGSFNVRDFIHTVDVVILAQEILVGGSSYPTEKIGENARNYRELGLGYANLGALLMTWGFPYDSDEARHTAAAITALMTGEAYRYSAEVAKRMGPYAGYAINKEPQLRVLSMHRGELDRVREDRVRDAAIYRAAEKAWDDAVFLGKKYGVRNSQVTVIAPTGTIALMMDCATTGIEPEFALVKTKNLVGGGTMRFVNTAIPDALKNIGYSDAERDLIVAHIESQGTIEGAPALKDEHVAVFDCAVRPTNGVRSIHWQGHVKMVAAVQPFISGAISKTFNMPADTTVDEIMKAYIMGWHLGLKAFAVYRDGSKAAQPLVTASGKAGSKKVEKPFRRRLPPTRPSETHKFYIAGHEGYLTYSMYENRDLAEIFITMSKQGSTLAGLLDAFAISISIALQHGVPLKTLARKFVYGRFEPAGFTENSDIQVATSITDYIFRYLALRFLSASDLDEIGVKGAPKEVPAAVEIKEMKAVVASEVMVKAPVAAEAIGSKVVFADSVCRECGGMLVQTGSCKTCFQCGTSTGGC